MSIEVGQRVRLTATFRNQASALANPTTVTIRVRRPSGAVETLDETNDSTGVYTAEVVVDAAGQWVATAIGSGNGVDTAITTRFGVAPNGA